MNKSLCVAAGLAFLLAGSAAGADEPAAVSPIVSINICAGPGLFGGYSFFIDQEGNMACQTVRPNRGVLDNAKYSDTRRAADGRQKDFEKFAKTISVQYLLTAKPGRPLGIPDELRVQVKLVLKNGTTVAASRWEHEDIPAFAPLIQCMNDFVKTDASKLTPLVVEYDRKNFNNTRAILDSVLRPAAPTGDKRP